MALQSAPKLLCSSQSSSLPGKPPKLITGDGFVSVDFIGLRCQSSWRPRRRVGVSTGSRTRLRRGFEFSASNGAAPSSVAAIKAVLDIERVNCGSSNVSSREGVQQAVNLEDILAERGACGVGFIAHLENKGSHQIVKDALVALGCMEHRGGCGADNDSGDGSGIMTSIPWDLFDTWANEQGLPPFDKLHSGVGMVFLPRDDTLMEEAKKGDHKCACA